MNLAETPRRQMFTPKSVMHHKQVDRKELPFSTVYSNIKLDNDVTCLQTSHSWLNFRRQKATVLSMILGIYNCIQVY